MRILDYCRTSAISSLVAAALVTAGLGSAIAGDPTGDWLVADGVAKVRVAECKGRMWGAISWEKEPGVDSNNADHAKQARPTLGMPLLFDMKKKANEDLWEGQVYDAKTTGRLQQASIRLLDPDKLEIKGCMLGILCGGETWTRAAPQFQAARPTVLPAPRRRQAWPRPLHRRLRTRPSVKSLPPVPPRRPILSAISVYFPTSRGRPINAG